MSCVVCSGPTSLRCSGCRSVFYCSRDHQKLHWSTHKGECKQTYVMSHSERLGRHLVAARDLEAGELILREVCLVLGPKAASGCVCLGCHRPLHPAAPFCPCPGCGWPLCSAQCRDSPHHTSECSLLEKAASRIQPASLLHAPLSAQVAAYSFITPLRCLLVKRSSSSRSWDALNDLQSHVDERASTPAYIAYRRNVAKFIGDVLGLYGDGFDDYTILKMCGILDTNSFEVKWNSPGAGQTKARGLFALTSMIAHDCRPNTRHTFEPEGDSGVPWSRVSMAVYTTVAVRKGDILTATYTQSLWPTKRRRAHLQAAKCFCCECQRCSDPRELATDFGAMRCLHAAKGGCDGLMLPTKPLEDDSRWKCTICHKETPSATIDILNDRLHNEILERASKANRKSMENGKKSSEVRMDPEVLEEFLTKHHKELHPMNHHIIQVKYALNQIYGKTPGFTLKELSNDKLKRKEQLCRQLLDVANVLEPGLTRFRADLLVDLHATVKELKERKVPVKKASNKSKQGPLEDYSKMLPEALKVLETENNHGRVQF
ncbi:SET domain-containing protein SmydA-8-like [Hetaerina americana]|uniref:SET domain-containing protein SmydA-8-like n=1 Tax=Hetaerina americana TaxID=62018 RepID=UPI003A7F3B4B